MSIFRYTIAVFLLGLGFFQPLSHATYRFSTTESLPKLAIIIDDIGYNIPLGQRTVNIDAKLTLSVLPKTPGAVMLAKAGFASGKEIMLHAPMSNYNDFELGPGALTLDMNKQQFQAVLNDSIKSIPHIRGVNNHMGSELTTYKQQMQWVMETLAPHNLYFIDSLTNSNSVAFKVAKENGITSQKRDVFLDHLQDEKAIEAAFFKLIKRAQNNGFAIGIGHPYPETLNVLERLLPTISQQNVELVHVSSLLNFK
ncbi:MAG: divergent polysaccharide deacetylase family protein [Pseudomonadales bacterium]|nr:divergent polysaccharide deacetylase family protein [Pseudomonadales bacterium]